MRLSWGVLLLLLVPAVPAAAQELPPRAKPARQRPALGGDRWAVVGKLYTPFDAVDCAATDAAELAKVYPPWKMRYVRYLTTQAFPAVMRDDLARLVSLALNSLSRKEQITLPAVGGPENLLVRVCLWDYGIDPRDWDALADIDPFFHQPVEKQELIVTATPQRQTFYHHGGDFRWPNGTVVKNVEPGWYYLDDQPATEVRAGKKVTQIAMASWTVSNQERDLLQAKKITEGQTRAGYLIATLQARAPILRADWFVVKALQSPFYYRLLRIKTLDDFDELTFLDKRLAKFEVQATVVRSGSYGLATPVSKNNRLLGRIKSGTGYRWETYDFKTSIRAQNVINLFNRLGNDDDADAQEFIATLLNGLQAYALTAKVTGRDLIDAGDIKVVRDVNFPDHEVLNARSCIFCHAKGLQPFRSHFQMNVTGLTQFFTFDKDQERAQEQQRIIEEKFGRPNWQAYLDGDMQQYRNAVRAATTWEPEVMAQRYHRLWDDYEEVDLDLNRIVYETGLQPQRIRDLIAVRLNGVNSGVLLQQLATPPIVIRRDQWEEVYQNLMTLSTAMTNTR